MVWYRHRISQKGRRRKASGHDSSGSGAEAHGEAGVGDPTGEQTVSSNKYSPPALVPSMAKLSPVGVGITGVAPAMPRRGSVAENVALPGVKGDTSDPSAVVTERFRIFKLEDEMFFRSTLGLLTGRCGDGGVTSTASGTAALVRTGVCGTSFDTSWTETEAVDNEDKGLVMIGIGGR